MKRALLTITVLILTVLFADAQEGSVPELINYQGKLTDVNGNPLDGMHKLEFNIWDQASLGTKLWGPQTFTGVQVIQGHFNVILGPRDGSARSIVDAVADSVRYLEILVDDSVISPRQRILSAPYAIQAEKAALATHHSNVVPIGSIMPFFGIEAPAGWLMCDGSEIDGGTNPELTDLVNYLRDENKVGSTEYRGSTSDRALLPDLRGIFLRGLNDFATASGPRSDGKEDPDGAGRNLGADQADEFKSHNHHNGVDIYLLRRTGIHTMMYADDSPTEPDLYHSGAIQDRGGNETRPRNVAVTYIIKY